MELAVEDLVVIRGNVRAVDGVSLRIVHGGWLGLIGANGSGKTSLLRSIAGRYETSGGLITCDGIDRSDDRVWRARTIGFAPDGAVLPDALSAAEYFALVQAEPGTSGDPRLAALRRALDFDGFIDRRLGTLSAGMRQRIAIYSAFLGGGETVFLDEPFNWLDPVCAFDTKEALSALVREGKLTLVTALHDISTLTLYCSEGALLSEGKLRRSISGDELKRGSENLGGFEADLITGLRSPQPHTS